MLILSVAVSIPGLVSMACESKEQKTSEKAVFTALTGMKGGDTNSVTGEASFDGLIQNADSPELKEFAKRAKAQTEGERDLNAIADDPNLR